MTDEPRINFNAVRADILRGLDLTAAAAEGYANYHRNHGDLPDSPVYAAHHDLLGKVMRRLQIVAGRGLLDHLAAAETDGDDSFETPYEARYVWHTIRLFRGPHLFDPVDGDFFEAFHPVQCSTLPPGADCWFTVDRRRHWWPTADQHGTYRIRPGYQLVGGGPDGDDPDTIQYWDIQALDETTGEWRDWRGRTAGQADAEAKEAAAAAAPPAADGRFHLQRRTIPEQLTYYADQLEELIRSEKVPNNTLSTIGAVVVGLPGVAAEIRAQSAKLRDHANVVELLGHLVDHEDTSCRIDIYGHCYEHNNPKPCGIPEARELLARIRSEQPGGTK